MPPTPVLCFARELLITLKEAGLDSHLLKELHILIVDRGKHGVDDDEVEDKQRLATLWHVSKAEEKGCVVVITKDWCGSMIQAFNFERHIPGNGTKRRTEKAMGMMTPDKRIRSLIWISAQLCNVSIAALTHIFPAGSLGV